ncbi:MAG: heavy metal-associated domain-containing protein [Tepidisphaeraceae bacterium]|jgi:copper chaperone CopZ
MAQDVTHDQLAVIRIEGMHCHKCEESIRKSLAAQTGVHEVEVDFNTGQASVLFDPRVLPLSRLMESVKQAGYRATGFTLGDKDLRSAGDQAPIH